jgi:hypothetical protein
MLVRANPHLATIRVVLEAKGKTKKGGAGAIETARYHLYRSIEAGDAAQARAWLNTLEAGVEAGKLTTPQMTKAIEGLSAIVAGEGLP